ncbi:MAG: HTH-type transcriptional regulator YofA [Alphaproteobacteria bacterium MarineAlpha3_Bin2]|nr:MAG: HTH-type transcriptional regulator YofA [Alphaproteobacteria bacterium MarineAlpha3_Bin1]PPR72959.1 MAG: HTH-type transcriptional regulator YofA [Alphaproteobacteria bacterium MarineAlpha3_Bin2]
MEYVQEPNMARNIDPALLRSFMAVAETGGMTSAGQMLNLTQAAISQQVKRLEDLFQVQLFERDKRTVHLTTDGERLLPLAQRMLETNDQVWGAMTSPDFEGEVHIGVPHDVIKAFMPPILKGFNRIWPRINVVIMPLATQSLLAALAAGEIDLTLTTERHVGDGGELLMADSLVWVGATDCRSHNSDPLPIAFGDKKCIFRASAMKALADAGREWRSVSEAGSMLSIYAALEADLAVGPLLFSTIPDGLAVLPPDAGLPALPDFGINMYLPKNGGSEIGRELASHIREQFHTRLHRVA